LGLSGGGTKETRWAEATAIADNMAFKHHPVFYFENNHIWLKLKSTKQYMNW